MTAGYRVLAPGPFRADQIREGDPYELSNGHPLLCVPTGRRGGLSGVGLGGVRLLAQEGTQAVGCGVGVKFALFRSLALPGGTTGPLLVAKLAGGGVNTQNDLGVWTVDTSGSLRLLFREGQRIGTKRVLSFTVLSAVSGSPGVTRAFNNNGQVAWRATFTDGTTGIVVTDIP